MAQVPFEFGDLKSNSFKSKEQKEPIKHVKGKVVTGSVLDKNKIGPLKWWRMIFEEDAKTVVKYLGTEVLVPKIKDTVYDLIISGVGRSIYKDDRKRGGNSTGEKVSYSSYYVSGGSKSVSRPKEQEVVDNNKLDYKNMLFADKSDADNVINGMISIIETYQQVTVADLYDLVGKTAPFTDNKFGWTDKDVHLFGVKRVRAGYLLELPTAYALD